MGHNLDWQLGSWGKGLVDTLGNVHTWSVNGRDGAPTHGEWEGMWLPSQASWTPLNRTFNISPKGAARFYEDGPEDTEAMDLVASVDPRLQIGMSKHPFFANTTHTWHYNRITGKRCECPYDGIHRIIQRIEEPTFSAYDPHPNAPNLNKVLRAPDKKLETPLGEEFRQYMHGSFPERYEALAPYIAHHWKWGNIRMSTQGAGPASQDPEPHLEWWGHPPAPDQHAPDKGYGWNKIGPDYPLEHWHDWYQARQHPTRQGVNVMDKHFTPYAMNLKADEHQADLARKEELDYFKNTGQSVYRFPGKPAGPSGFTDWEQAWAELGTEPQRPGVYDEESPEYQAWQQQHTEWSNRYEALNRMQKAEEYENKYGRLPNWIGDTNPPNPNHVPLEDYQAVKQQYPEILPARKKGWEIRQLMNGSDLEAEGEMMSHCIGSDEQPYKECLENGQIQAFSLRDPDGEPHITWHYNSDGTLAEMFAPSDSVPKPQYQQMVNEWGDHTGKETERGNAVGMQERAERDHAYLPQADTQADYVRFHHPDHRREAAEEYDNEGHGVVGPNTYIESEHPNLHAIAHEYLNEGLSIPGWARHTTGDHDNQFFETLWNESHEDDFNGELEEHLRSEYPNWPHLDPEEYENYVEKHEDQIERWANDYNPRNANLGHPGHKLELPDPEPPEEDEEDEHDADEEPEEHEDSQNPPLHRVREWEWPHGEPQEFSEENPEHDPETGWRVHQPHLRPGQVPLFFDRLPSEMGYPQWMDEHVRQQHAGGFVRTADKLHDFLMNPQSRPDLQTPEAQDWLKMLNVHQEAVGPKLDPLTPWLTREWKKGRLLHAKGENPSDIGHIVPDEEGTGMLGHISARDLGHWADFYNSNHPIKRQMGDIMQTHVGDYQNYVDEWDKAMTQEAERKALEGGQVVHSWPDGWSVRQLTTPEELKGEGSTMGHCVGSYANQVQSGQCMIYSLRDHEGHPHVTTEISPRNYEESEPFDLERAFQTHPTMRHAPEGVRDMIRAYDQHPNDPVAGTVPKMQGWNDDVGPGGMYDTEALHKQLLEHHRKETRKPIPEGGDVVQIQGQSNTDPKDEYKQRMREWFDTFHKKPKMDEEAYLDEPRDIKELPQSYRTNQAGGVNEYGLENSATSRHAPDWTELMKQNMEEGGYYSDDMLDLAHDRHELDELRYVAEAHSQKKEREREEAIEHHMTYYDEPQDPESDYYDWEEMDPDEKRYAEAEHNEKMEEYNSHKEGIEAAAEDEHGSERDLADELAWKAGRRLHTQQVHEEEQAKQNVSSKNFGYENLRRGSFIKSADKLHDFLMNPQSRPDLQNPEAQAFLQTLHKLQENIGQKMDPLTPWLTREWKKGRIQHEIEPMAANPLRPGRLRYEAYMPQGYREGENPSTEWNYLRPDQLSHWADFMGSNHPLKREMGDIMQHQIPAFDDRIHNWNEAMKQEAEQKSLEGGKVVHSWPDGWSVRRLTTPEELKGEGNAMGHCVGGYDQQVANGTSMIYSLRDPEGHPHVTTEITPQYVRGEDGRLYDKDNLTGTIKPEEWVPDKGQVVQIQGRSNQTPKDEYKERLREWFSSWPYEQRPRWGDGNDEYPLEDPHQIEQKHLHPPDSTIPMDEYGLPVSPVQIDYPAMLGHFEDKPRYSEYERDGDDARRVFEAARMRGEIPQLGEAFKDYRESIWQKLQELEEQNWDYQYDYTGPEPDQREEEIEQMEPEERAEKAEQASDGYGYGQDYPWYEDEYEWPWDEKKKAQAQRDYEDRYNQWYKELTHDHYGKDHLDTFEGLLKPHYNPQTEKYEDREPPLTASVKTADKLNDFLRNPKSRPDLQTPEAQQWLAHLEGLMGQAPEASRPAIDAMAPWLTREWKKGRINYEPGRVEPSSIIRPARATYQIQPPAQPGIYGDPDPQNRRLTSGQLEHWANFMGSNHPLKREMGDIMQQQVGPFHQRAEEWERQAQEEEKERQRQEQAKKGEVVHAFPDNWTIKRLTDPESLDYEGEQMGHCVGGYASRVGRGDSLIYSLRDPKGEPHATVEIQPTQYAPVSVGPFDLEHEMENHPVWHQLPEEGKDRLRQYAKGQLHEDEPITGQHPKEEETVGRIFNKLHGSWRDRAAEEEKGAPIPDKGRIVQIQGKSNQEPNDEYKEALKEWFQSFAPEDKPTREAYNERGELTHPEEIEDEDLDPDWGDEDEYGLDRALPRVNWKRMVENMGRDNGRYYEKDPYEEAEFVYNLARAHEAIPEMAQHWQNYDAKTGEEMELLEEENHHWINEHVGQDPGLRKDPEWQQMGEQEKQAEQEAYYERQSEARSEIEENHKPSEVTRHMGELLMPHYNQQTGSYQNGRAPRTQLEIPEFQFGNGTTS